MHAKLPSIAIFVLSMSTRVTLTVFAFLFGESLQAQNAQQPVDAFSWIDPAIPKPDADGWITLFDGKKLHGTPPAAILAKGNAIGVTDGYLWVENTGVYFDISARNVIIRAMVKKVNGQNATLSCRIADGRNYTGWFNGGADFGIGIARPKFGDLVATKSSRNFSDYFQMELIAQEGMITLKAEDKVVAATTDATLDLGGSVSVYALKGRSQFKKIQVKILDAPLPPLPWTSADGVTIKGTYVRLDGEAVVILKDGKEVTIPFARLDTASVEQAKKSGNDRSPANRTQQGEIKSPSETGQQPTAGLTPSQAAKLFSAYNVRLEPDNKIILTYTFRYERELADFEYSPGGAKATASYLEITAGNTLKHKAVFLNNAQIQCKMAQKNWNSDFVSTTSGQKLAGENYNSWFIHLKSPFGDRKDVSAKFDEEYTKTGSVSKYFPIEFTLNDQGAKATFGKFGGKDIVLALTGNNSSIGSFSFHGGSGGSQLKELTISGKLDPAWISQQH